MRRLFYVTFGFIIFFGFHANAQGNIHSPGEGGVFTANRLAGLKGNSSAGYAEEYDLGNNPSAMNLFSDLRMKFARLGEEVNLTLDDIDGTIYVDESFQLGALYHNGVVFKRMYARYDAYNDEIELRTSPNAETTRAMVKNEEYSCSIQGNEFVFMEYVDENGAIVKGYLTPMVRGREYVLYQKQLKVFKEGKLAKTSLDRPFPHRFLDRTKYYVSIDGGTPSYMKTKKKEVLSVFSDKDQKEVKKYMKDKRSNVDKDIDLLNLFAYANTL